MLACDISFRMAHSAHWRLQTRAWAQGCALSCQQMAAEEMAYASGVIDMIFGVSVLHHLELLMAVQEVKRVLKPGGRAIFVEPLNHNPIANLYRALTPTRHSESESPLDYNIFDLLKRHFPQAQHKEFYLVSMGAAFFAFLKSRRLFDWAVARLSKADEILIFTTTQIAKICLDYCN